MVDNAEIIPASVAHRFMWVRDRLFGRNGVLAVPIIFRFQGELSVADLQGALDDLVARHAGLRTTFEWHERHLEQHVHPPGWTPLTLTPLDCPAGPDPLEAAYQEVRTFLRERLDLSVAPVRAALWRLADDDHLFVLDPHHIVTDAWSNMILARDLAAFYRARWRREPASLPAVTWQYADFAARQEERADDPVMQKHQAYLLSMLHEVRFPTLPPISVPPGQRRAFSATEWFGLPAGQLAALRKIAREERTSLFVLLLSLYFLALQETTQAPDIAVSTITANRGRQEIQETVGLFANMLVVRIRLGAEPAILDVVRAVRRSVLAGLSHAEFPYARLPLNSWRKGASGEPRDVVFHMLAEPPTSRAEDRVDFGDLRVEQHHIPDGLGCRFELEMLIVPGPGGLQGVIKYADDRFEPDYVRELIRRYLAALAELAGHRMSVPALD